MIKSIVSSLFLFCTMLVSVAGYAQSQKEIDDKILTEYFAKNKIKATMTPSGLYYVVSKKGNGPNVKPGQSVSMKYLGTFLDGKRFDGNMDENFELKGNPFTFTLGRGQVIKGWDEGVQFFSVGGQGTLYLPSGVAYGERGVGPIPPNSVLVFHVEVVSAN
jgi:FKBP-type peptidyl-prolyl cis-trans isomerase FkpA